MVTPERLGRYEIRGVLGSGAMGTVYAAWDPDLARGVALKIIRNPQVDEEALRRFRREAQALARLTHPHIVAVHDVGTDNGAPYIVMELIQGTTLASEIAAGIERPLTEKVALAAQVCDALAFAHGAGIIHRDVKPGNILITSDGVAKLADFGLARLQNSSLTGTADVVGTPAYLAPEAFSGTELDARADVYGIAASLFEWVSGSQPHEAEHLATLMARVLHHDAPDIRDRWPHCPPQLSECLRRGLARDRSERYPTAGAFGDALRALRVSAEEKDVPVTVIVDGHRSGLQAHRNRSRVFSAAIALFVLLTAALATRNLSAPTTLAVASDDAAPAPSSVQPPVKIISDGEAANVPTTARTPPEKPATDAILPLQNAKPANSMPIHQLMLSIEGPLTPARDEADVLVRRRFKVTDDGKNARIHLVLTIEAFSTQERLYGAEVIRSSGRASLKIIDSKSAEVLRRSSAIRTNTIQDPLLGQTAAVSDAVIAILEEPETRDLLGIFRSGGQ